MPLGSAIRHTFQMSNKKNSLSLVAWQRRTLASPLAGIESRIRTGDDAGTEPEAARRLRKERREIPASAYPRSNVWRGLRAVIVTALIVSSLTQVRASLNNIILVFVQEAGDLPFQ